MSRPNVLWFGSRKGRPDDDAFTERELKLQIVSSHELSTEQLASARGLVLSFGGDMVSKVREFAEKNVVTAIEHGLTIYVLASEDEVLLHAHREMEKLGIKLYTERLASTAPDHQVAHHMMIFPVSNAPSAKLEIKLEQGAERLSDADILLLRRAFADCEHIRLVELGGGKTAETFMVEAKLAGAASLVGPRPLPFFVKLGKREKVAEEVAKYKLYGENFVPFYLRPNLDLSRCVSGHTRGILVGNFVERAEPLWSVTCKGEAHAAIHSLFDLTLAGWRAQGFQRSTGLRSGSVAGGLGSRIFDFNKVKSANLVVAETKGLTRSPQGLWEALMELEGHQRYYNAPMHGDLHPGNVFVRGGDAILIDLASIQDGPLSGDLACLEVALLFETRSGDEMVSEEVWLKAADEFYAPESFRQLPPPAFGADSWSARLNCARQVRMVALPTQACETEYMSAIAVYLLRRSMHDAGNATDALRRGYAMVIADRLVSALKEQEQ